MKRRRKESRTIPLRASGDEEGLWYRCWHCGFRCKVGRDELGEGVGVSYEEFDPTLWLSSTGPTSDPRAIAVLDDDLTSLQTDSFGDTLDAEEKWRAVVTSGCPFCGSRNWRGDV